MFKLQTNSQASVWCHTCWAVLMGVMKGGLGLFGILLPPTVDDQSQSNVVVIRFWLLSSIA